MKVVVIGAAGMIGAKLAARLVVDGEVAGRAITHLTLADVIRAEQVSEAGFPVVVTEVDITEPDAAAKLVASRPEVIFHLAGVVSGEAEADFDKGYGVNLDGTRNLFEAIRSIDGYVPRVVFTSSIAVFGAPFPDAIPDDYFHTPLTSYGTQKAISELLLADFTRRGFMDGIGIRLPTICVRPGLPNKAASGFFSGIIREPLAGKEAVLPVSQKVLHWFASPRLAVGFLLHAAALDGQAVGPRRSLTMPGVAETVGGEIEALRKVAGEAVAARIRPEPDETIMRIVAGWPTRFDAERSRKLGFQAETSFEAIIRAHIDDELGGDWVH